MYSIGEKLDTTGMEVTGYYDNGTERKLSDSQYSVSGFDSSVPGEKTVTITAKEDNVTATVKVTVGGDSVEDIPVLPVVAAEDQLPETLTLKVNGEIRDTAVTWNLKEGDWSLPGSTVKLEGVLENLDAGTISWSPVVYSSTQVYFIDCGIGVKRGTVDNTGRTSEIFNAVHDAVKYLENDVPDQAGDGNSWGKRLGL